MIEERLKTIKDAMAMHVTRNGKHLTWTFGEYYRDIRCFASAILELGIKERGCINVIGFNSPEWVISFMGIEHYK